MNIKGKLSLKTSVWRSTSCRTGSWRTGSSSGNGGSKQSKDGKIHVADLTIEPENWRAWKGDKELHLPNREFELLRFLAENPNIVFSKETLFEKIWGYDYVSDAATVSVHINRLREKIEEDARNPQIIETIWGVGYRLNGGHSIYRL